MTDQPPSKKVFVGVIDTKSSRPEKPPTSPNSHRDTFQEVFFKRNLVGFTRAEPYGDLAFRPLRNGESSGYFGFQSPARSRESCVTFGRWMNDIARPKQEIFKAEIDNDGRNIAHFAAVTGCLDALPCGFVTEDMMTAPDKDGLSPREIAAAITARKEFGLSEVEAEKKLKCVEPAPLPPSRYGATGVVTDLHDGVAPFAAEIAYDDVVVLHARGTTRIKAHEHAMAFAQTLNSQAALLVAAEHFNETIHSMTTEEILALPNGIVNTHGMTEDVLKQFDTKQTANRLFQTETRIALERSSVEQERSRALEISGAAPSQSVQPPTVGA